MTVKKLYLILCTLLFTCLTSFGQELIVRGVVSDATGYSLPGVNVFNLNTKTGTITNIDGAYEVKAQKGDELQFSYISMKTITSKVTGSKIDVVLHEDSEILNEVVVIGYGTSTKKDLTGAVASIKLEDTPLASIPNVNVLESLKGSLPGINIGISTSAGGTPGFSIRGQNSISAGNSPLLVVDGIIGGDFAQLNPQDIASIDVLKDASSAAVYGSRAANGVIIVTTKRGKTEKPQFNFNMSYGVNSWTRKPKMMNGKQYLQLRKDFYTAQGYEGSDLEPENFLKPKEWSAYQAGSEYNWLDEASRTGNTQNYQLSVSGAGDKFNYYVSANHYSQKGILKGDDFTRTSVLAKLEATVNDYIKAGINVSGNIRDYSGIGPDMYQATYLGPWGYMNSTEVGYENWLERYPGGNTTWSNPLWSSYGVDDKDTRYGASLKSFAEFKLPWVEGLSWRVNAAYNLSQVKQGRFNHENHYVNTMRLTEMRDPSMFLKNANGNSRSNNGNSWLMNQIINYNRTFGLHKIDLTLMSERQRSHSDGVYASASDFEQAGTTVLGYNSLELGNVEKRGVDSYKTQSSQLAYMGRVNYVYKNRYHGSASFRRDGFSAFGEGHKFGNFYSGALAWTITEEDFMKNDILNYMKLRFSYGENGNPSIASYSTFPTIGYGAYIFGTEYVKSMYQNKLANKTLGWERTQAYNFGVDFGLFNDRLTGNIEYYNSMTRDLLVTRRLPITTGYGSILDNMGKLANWGLEISLRSKNIQTHDFSWSTGLSFWMNRNKIKSLYGMDTDGDGREDDDLNNGWFIGKSLGAIYSYTVDGIVQESDTEYRNQYNAQPGDVKFVDISGPEGIPDGKIDATYDRSIIGYTSPNFRMNMSNTLEYKNFQLYFSLDYVNGGGNRYMSDNEKGFNPNRMPDANWLAESYWTPENPSNVSPRANYNNTRGWGFYQSREFLRLQDISLSYSFSSELLNKTKLFTSAKVFVSGKNLLTITDWRGMDPEAGQRIGEGSPSSKLISVGANISF